jgi:hypothetical protein
VHSKDTHRSPCFGAWLSETRTAVWSYFFFFFFRFSGGLSGGQWSVILNLEFSVLLAEQSINVNAPDIDKLTSIFAPCYCLLACKYQGSRPTTLDYAVIHCNFALRFSSCLRSPYLAPLTPVKSCTRRDSRRNETSPFAETVPSALLRAAQLARHMHLEPTAAHQYRAGGIKSHSHMHTGSPTR